MEWVRPDINWMPILNGVSVILVSDMPLIKATRNTVSPLSRNKAGSRVLGFYTESEGNVEEE